MALKGGKVGTLKKLKQSVKRGGGNSLIKYIPKEGGMRLRFLHEPTEWVEWFEHFDEENKRGVPCDADDCRFCDAGVRASKRYLAAALDMDNGKAQVIVSLPTSAVDTLAKRYEKYETLLDRDYSVSRDGSGLDTTYDVETEAPSRVTLDRYVVPDLDDVLQSLADGAEDDDDDSDEDDSPRPARKAAPAKKAAPKRRTILDEDDDDDEEEEVRPVRRPLKKPVPAKKTIRRPLRK